MSFSLLATSPLVKFEYEYHSKVFNIIKPISRECSSDVLDVECAVDKRINSANNYWRKGSLIRMKSTNHIRRQCR